MDNPDSTKPKVLIFEIKKHLIFFVLPFQNSQVSCILGNHAEHAYLSIAMDNHPFLAENNFVDKRSFQLIWHCLQGDYQQETQRVLSCQIPTFILPQENCTSAMYEQLDKQYEIIRFSN